jgi:hypothetical protein
MAKRRQADHEAEIDRLMRRFATLADRMREHGVYDESQLSVAEQLVARALAASDNGADPSVFWPTLRQELRAWLDENPITRAM